MQHPPPLQQQTAVGHLVRQGMLEGVCRARGTGGSRTGTRRPGGAPGRGVGPRRAGPQWPASRGKGHLGANDGGGLEQALLLRRQPVNACCQHRLHRGRHLDRRQGLRQAIRPGLAHQHAGLYQGAHALLQEEGIALGPRNEELLERCQTGVVPQQGREERLGAGRAAAGRAAVACSTSCCPSRAGTRDDS